MSFGVFEVLADEMGHADYSILGASSLPVCKLEGVEAHPRRGILSNLRKKLLSSFALSQSFKVTSCFLLEFMLVILFMESHRDFLFIELKHCSSLTLCFFSGLLY